VISYLDHEKFSPGPGNEKNGSRIWLEGPKSKMALGASRYIPRSGSVIRRIADSDPRTGYLSLNLVGRDACT
jgi:hypothetical protein